MPAPVCEPTVHMLCGAFLYLPAIQTIPAPFPGSLHSLPCPPPCKNCTQQYGLFKPASFPLLTPPPPSPSEYGFFKLALAIGMVVVVHFIEVWGGARTEGQMEADCGFRSKGY